MEKGTLAFVVDLISIVEKILMSMIKRLCLILQLKRGKKSLVSLLLILKYSGSFVERGWLKVNVQTKMPGLT